MRAFTISLLTLEACFVNLSWSIAVETIYYKSRKLPKKLEIVRQNLGLNKFNDLHDEELNLCALREYVKDVFTCTYIFI